MNFESLWSPRDGSSCVKIKRVKNQSNSPSVDSQQENLEIYFYGIDFEQIVIIGADGLWVDNQYVLVHKRDNLRVLRIAGEDFYRPHL